MLNSYSIPVAITKNDNIFVKSTNRILAFADHTYVTSSEGHKWGCNGRSKGGILIGSGIGNPTEADCIYRSDKDLAGIRYAITGVCHQISNRTLYPANIKVEKAKCYFLSKAIYGEYGYYKAAWERRRKECTLPHIYEIEHAKLKYALLMQRYSFSKYGIPKGEINSLFGTSMGADNFNSFEASVRILRINFLSLAIKYLDSRLSGNSFSRLAHDEFNIFLKTITEYIGVEAISKLLGLEEYKKNSYILLFQSFENQKANN